ncbi:MAG: hypothetical protein GQ574_02900 [Crocinitomix sp.]|nr:hypothetical protein [Crocinitomix sp.]
MIQEQVLDKTTQEPLWEEKTHKAIIEKALELMSVYVPNGTNKNVNDFLTIFHKNSDFMSCLYQGLKDADDKAPWNDHYWAYHFYNPKTKKTYNKDKKTTAHSEARRYFKLSEHYAQRIRHFNESGLKPGAQLYKNAGYYMGLSLHFLTDLTQPMHAANFTNLLGDEGNEVPRPDLRHAGFEIYTDNAIERGLLNDLKPLEDHHLAAFPKNSIGMYIHQVALTSKNTFDSLFLPVLKKKVFYEIAGIPIMFEGYWRASEADPLIHASTVNAPYTVANYLTNYMLLSSLRPTIDSNKWYEILEPTEAPENHSELDKFKVADLTDGMGQWVHREKPHGGDQQRFYFLCNPDGTVSIGCKKDNMNKLWQVETGRSPSWIGQGETNKRNNKFRITAFENGKVMLFESSKNEVVHVNSGEAHGDWHGWFTRFATAFGNNQWFILRERGEISEEDKKKIKAHYSDYNQFNWAGQIGVVPAWEANIPNKLGDEQFQELGHDDGPKGEKIGPT